jgi:hypothetical protein
VGSYEVVAEELATYMEAGYRTFILDISPTREEYGTSSLCSKRLQFCRLKRGIVIRRRGAPLYRAQPGRMIVVTVFLAWRLA